MFLLARRVEGKTSGYVRVLSALPLSIYGSEWMSCGSEIRGVPGREFPLPPWNYVPCTQEKKIYFDERNLGVKWKR